MDYRQLKERQRAERAGYPENLALRVQSRRAACGALSDNQLLRRVSPGAALPQFAHGSQCHPDSESSRRAAAERHVPAAGTKLSAIDLPTQARAPWASASDRHPGIYGLRRPPGPARKSTTKRVEFKLTQASLWREFESAAFPRNQSEKCVRRNHPEWWSTRTNTRGGMKSD